MRTQIEIRKRAWPFVVDLHQNESPPLILPPSPANVPASSALQNAGERETIEIPPLEGKKASNAVPVGFVHVEGEFAADHSNELLRLFRQHEKQRQQQQPGERILDIVGDGSGLVVSTNSMPFVRSLALQLSACYWGSLALKYSQGNKSLHAFWWH